MICFIEPSPELCFGCQAGGQAFSRGPSAQQSPRSSLPELEKEEAQNPKPDFSPPKDWMTVFLARLANCLVFLLGRTLGHHWVAASSDFTPQQAQAVLGDHISQGTCQISWHIFFITSELGDSDQLSSPFPPHAWKVQTFVRTTLGLIPLAFGSLAEEPISLT